MFLLTIFLCLAYMQKRLCAEESGSIRTAFIVSLSQHTYITAHRDYILYRAFHQFGQAKIRNGGLALGSS